MVASENNSELELQTQALNFAQLGLCLNFSKTDYLMTSVDDLAP